MSYGIICDGCGNIMYRQNESQYMPNGDDVSDSSTWLIETPRDGARFRSTIHLHNEQCLLPWLEKTKAEREKKAELVRPTLLNQFP